MQCLYLQVSEKEAEALKVVQSRAEEIEKQLKEKPDDLDAKQTLLDLATALGDYKRARTLAEQIVQAEPQNSKAWLILVREHSCMTQTSDGILFPIRLISMREMPNSQVVLQSPQILGQDVAGSRSICVPCT